MAVSNSSWVLCVAVSNSSCVLCVPQWLTLECPLLQAQVKAVSRAPDVAWMLAPGEMRRGGVSEN